MGGEGLEVENLENKGPLLESAGHDGADVVAAEAAGVSDDVLDGGKGGHLGRHGEGGLAEGLGGEGGLLVDVGLGLDLLMDVGLGLHLLVDVGGDLGGGRGGAHEGEEDLNRMIFLYKIFHIKKR